MTGRGGEGRKTKIDMVMCMQAEIGRPTIRKRKHEGVEYKNVHRVWGNGKENHSRKTWNECWEVEKKGSKRQAERLAWDEQNRYSIENQGNGRNESDTER